MNRLVQICIALLGLLATVSAIRRPLGKVSMRRSAGNPFPSLPKLPALFSSGSNGGSLVPPTPPGDDAMIGEDGGEGNKGMNGKSPLTALGLWLTGGLDKYNALLQKNPHTTKIVTAAVIGGLGDIVSQRISDKDAALDWRRLVMFTIAAAFYFAPVIGAWFSFLNSINVPGSAGTKAVAMIMIDQTFGAVGVIGTYFFFYEVIDHLVPGGSACIEGMDPIKSIITKGTDSFKNTLPGVLVANWKVWPLINFLNFRYVTPSYQLLVSNLVSFFWNIYLAGVTASK